MQRLSTALRTEFVGGCEQVWTPASPMENAHVAFRPRRMDSLAVDGLGSGLVMLVPRSSSHGLPLSLSHFSLGVFAPPQAKHGLAGDKGNCAAGVAGKRDSYVV